MELLWIILGGIFVIAGILGSFLPVVPGPPLSYIGLLLLQLTADPPFSISFLVFWAIITAIAVTLDSLVPATSSRRYGGSKYGIYGCLIGGLIGLFFFPPIGIFVGPVAGAFIGEIIVGKKSDSAFRAAMGSFVGIFVATVLKFAVTLIMAYYFFSSLG